MSDFSMMVLHGLIIKLTLIAVGALTIYLGYRLFHVQLKRGGGGELQAAYAGAKLTLRSAAPGTFFALFGACIIGTVTIRPVEMGRVEIAEVPPEHAQTPQAAVVVPKAAVTAATASTLRGAGQPQAPQATAEAPSRTKSKTLSEALRDSNTARLKELASDDYYPPPLRLFADGRSEDEQHWLPNPLRNRPLKWKLEFFRNQHPGEDREGPDVLAPSPPVIS
jgi:hypothetical protein